MRNEGSRAPADPHHPANRLVEEHLHLVQHVVKQLAAHYPRHIDRSELWSAGASGLVDASRRYDPRTGVPFARYAAIRIRGAIVDSTRTRDWASRSLRRDMRAMASERAAFEQRHGRAPTSDELAKRLGCSTEQLVQQRGAAMTATLLHLDQAPSVEADEPPLGERLPERDDAVIPDAALEHQEMLGTVRAAIAFLPAVQRDVIERYFFGNELLRDIAASLGVTEARVSQLRSEALNAMQAYFAAHFDGVPDVAPDAPGMRRRAAYVDVVADGSDWRSRLDWGEQPCG